MLNIDILPTKIKNVETLVERIIQETFFEAFYEYYMLKKKDSDNINFSYETTEVEEVVTLRKKVKQNGQLFPSQQYNEKKFDGKNADSKHKCIHRNTQKVNSRFVFETHIAIFSFFRNH